MDGFSSREKARSIICDFSYFNIRYAFRYFLSGLQSNLRRYSEPSITIPPPENCTVQYLFWSFYWNSSLFNSRDGIYHSHHCFVSRLENQTLSGFGVGNLGISGLFGPVGPYGTLYLRLFYDFRISKFPFPFSGPGKSGHRRCTADCNPGQHKMETR